MNYSVEISEQVNADLRGIFEYIAFELQSSQSAAGQLSRLVILATIQKESGLIT